MNSTQTSDLLSYFASTAIAIALGITALWFYYVGEYPKAEFWLIYWGAFTIKAKLSSMEYNAKYER